MQTIVTIAIALFILVIIFARRVLIQEDELFELKKEKQKLKDLIEVQEGIIEKQTLNLNQ